MKINEIMQNNKEGFSIVVKENNIKLEVPYLLSKENNKFKGYAVALTDNKVTNINDIEPLYKRLCNMALMVNNPNIFIGGWSDGENFYLDLSILARNEEEAVYLKAMFKQKAIFDLNRWECV